MKQEQKTHVSADALIQLLKGAKAIRWQLALGGNVGSLFLLHFASPPVCEA